MRMLRLLVRLMLLLVRLMLLLVRLMLLLVIVLIVLRLLIWLLVMADADASRAVTTETENCPDCGKNICDF